ncbi:DUF1223 domain-containing protein [Mucilaginibacter sp. BJC16-A38]|uniref:DUF1223 domain-containing protein n=1 Tax=Mucilaginibacter phenanthrenivorans TaxID=1234842 RepID=UPI002157A945|nr:DUF1223 domain-containing protein [Mucilaginibacter phenanthrenivorans]MCR8557294.1 DUF1223 domain-containing protein [Mucilaginibacter phenanthrenivorans]
MKPIKLSVIGAAFVLLVITAALVTKSFASKTNRSIAGDGFAVLELFTSEGCSSCPPADELLARIQRENGNKPVYVLAFHVDYWNRQGWKDVFSNPLFSKRQYQYSSSFTGQVYTPQVIVNGKSEFVGGDENAAQNALNDALSAHATESLSLKGEQHARKMKIDYQLEGNTKDNQLVIAVVEKHAVSKVTKGENEGRTLHHAQIVRNLYTFDLKTGKNGSVQIDLPADFDAKDWEIVGLLQSPDTRVINAAGRAQLTSEAATPAASK